MSRALLKIIEKVIFVLFYFTETPKGVFFEFFLVRGLSPRQTTPAKIPPGGYSFFMIRPHGKHPETIPKNPANALFLRLAIGF